MVAAGVGFGLDAITHYGNKAVGHNIAQHAGRQSSALTDAVAGTYGVGIVEAVERRAMDAVDIEVDRVGGEQRAVANITESQR